MRNIIKCILISTVWCSTTYSLPVTQPVYSNSNAQYVSAQAVPQITYKQPAAQGYAQPQQYVRPQYVQVPQVTPVYEYRTREGLQNYASQGQEQPVQQVQKAVTPYYLNQVQNAQLAAQAKEAFAAAQRKASSLTYSKPPIVQASPVYQQPQQAQTQPQQYIREQPQQVRYVPRTSVAQNKAPQVQKAREEEQEDYDHNPNYQFGFDVKDDLYTNYQNRKEQREGNKITGSYSVVDSDGFIRTVQYTADPKEGFKAEGRNTWATIVAATVLSLKLKVTRQPTDIVVKIPKPDPQFQQQQRQQQYIQETQYIGPSRSRGNNQI